MASEHELSLLASEVRLLVTENLDALVGLLHGVMFLLLMFGWLHAALLWLLITLVTPMLWRSGGLKAKMTRHHFMRAYAFYVLSSFAYLFCFIAVVQVARPDVSQLMASPLEYLMYKPSFLLIAVGMVGAYFMLLYAPLLYKYHYHLDHLGFYLTRVNKDGSGLADIKAYRRSKTRAELRALRDVLLAVFAGLIYVFSGVELL